MPFLGVVLSLIGNLCLLAFRVIGYVFSMLWRTRLWIAAVIFFLGWLIFPTAYTENPVVQVGMLILGLTLTGISWGYTAKKRRGYQADD